MNKTLELTQSHKKKIKWTLRMAVLSLGFLMLGLLVNEFRHLFGFRKGFGGHNFAFNFSFFLPITIIALTLAIAVIGRTIKHWKTWNNIKRKWLLIGLAFPAIGFWIYNISRMILMSVE
jgi:hypothetical protein